MTRIKAALVVALVIGSLSTVGTAHAYDAGSCTTGRTWHDFDYPRLEGGAVDFGDDAHIGGAPQGNAVVCWEQGRRHVEVIGKLFNEAGSSSDCVGITIDLYSTTGAHMLQTARELCKTGWHGLSAGVVSFTFRSVNPIFNRVRIRLSTYVQGGPATFVPINGDANKYYGD